jgi:hypothetical protein
MDPRVELLKEFYGGLPRDRAKVETHEFGFEFLERLLSGGTTLEYGELTLSGMLHKYKLAGIPVELMDELLLSHVEKRRNVCLYFDDRANSTFCFNLDNNHKTNNTEIIPEMEIAVRATRDSLARLGCEPLVVASGRGYHIWCRLDRAIENGRLYDFMRRIAVRTLATLHEGGHDHRKVKFNVYPDRRTRDTVSLRLFGSDHAKNRVFSRVLTPGGLLDEAQSWEHFERHLRLKTVSAESFDRAFDAVSAAA